MQSKRRRRDPLDRRYHITEAACAAWVPHLTRAATRVDVVPNSLNGIRLSALVDFRSDTTFVFTEAVAHHSVAEPVFLPHRHSNVCRREGLSRRIVVDGSAILIHTESVIRDGKSLKGLFGEQCLHGQQLDRNAGRATRRTCGTFG